MKKLISRRQFVLSTSLATLGLGSVIGLGYRSKRINRNSTKLSTLSSAIDTIIPSGVISSDQYGALDLGIDKTVQQLAKNNPRYGQQIDLLVSGIEKTATTDYKDDFSTLNIDEREVLITRLLTQKTQPSLGRAIRALRATVMRIYYTSQEGRAHLGYTLPADYSNY